MDIYTTLAFILKNHDGKGNLRVELKFTTPSGNKIEFNFGNVDAQGQRVEKRLNNKYVAYCYVEGPIMILSKDHADYIEDFGEEPQDGNGDWEESGDNLAELMVPLNEWFIYHQGKGYIL